MEGVSSAFRTFTIEGYESLKGKYPQKGGSFLKAEDKGQKTQAKVKNKNKNKGNSCLRVGEAKPPQQYGKQRCLVKIK